MKTLTKTIIALLLLLIFMLFVSTYVNATPDDLMTYNYRNDKITKDEYNKNIAFYGKIEKILTILRGISIFVALISVSILGVKYIVGSVEEKAQYKERLIPIAIGAFLIAGISTLLVAIEKIMN